MSFYEVTSPLTGIGVRLDKPLELTTPQFLVHECGFLPNGVHNWESGAVLTPYWCLWYVQGPGYWVEAHGKRWELSPHQMVFGPANVVLSTHGRHFAPHLWVHFSMVPAYAFEASEPFAVPVTNLLQEILNALLEAHNGSREDRARLLFHHAAALLNVCFANHPLPMRVLPDALRTVLHEIERAPGSDLSNARLAFLAGLSPSRFASWFENYMKESPATYVRRVRHDKASRLLVFTDLSIKQIAAELGFPNRHYFSRAFATHTGYGPATFRKNHRAMKTT